MPRHSRRQPTANADNNAAWVIKQRGITHVRSDSFLKGKIPRTIKVQRKKAQELASSGRRNRVGPESKAVVIDALNSRRTIEDHCFLETSQL